MAILDVIYPSGYALPSGMFLFSVIPDLCTLLTIISGSSSRLKLYEANDLLIYGDGNGLLRYVGEIQKIGNYTSAICKTSEDYVVTFSNVLYPTSACTIRSQKEPLTSVGWTTQSTVAGLFSSDAISDDQGYLELPILTGNSRQAASILVYQQDANIPPFNNFTDSDSGILQFSVITDLEATI